MERPQAEPSEQPRAEPSQPRGPAKQPAEPAKQRSEQTAATPADAKAGDKRPSRKRFLLGAAGIAALAAASWYGYDYVTVGQYIVSTDDAYVGVDMSIISPKVAANVAGVPIVDNQHVEGRRHARAAR